jgi:alkylation response protein AidB-like acyl-CoA dehydrogenase
MSYRSVLSRVLATVVAPCAEQTASRDVFPRSSVNALGRGGLLGLTAPRELGGGGRGMDEAAEVVAEVSRVCPATAAVLRSHYAAAAAIELYGSRWLRGEIAAGRHLTTVALADRLGDDRLGADRLGDDEPPSTAVRTGDVVALQGCKRPVVAAGEADSYLWSARTPAAPGREGLTLWLVPACAPGLYVPLRGDGDAPRGSATSTVRADHARVPVSAMLGSDGAGLDTILETVVPWLTATHVPAGADDGFGAHANDGARVLSRGAT